MRTFTFNKENDGWIDSWYVLFPEWEGEKSELEMVSGADDMLDKLSNNSNTITLEIHEKPQIQNDAILTFLSKEYGGGNYSCMINNEIFKVWLCHVTIFIYGYLPRMLYIKVV